MVSSSSLLPLRRHNHQRLPPTLQPKKSHLWSSCIRCGELCGGCRNPYPGRKRRYSDVTNHHKNHHNDDGDDDDDDDDRDIVKAVVSQRKPILLFLRQNKKMQRLILVIVIIIGCCGVGFCLKLLLTMRSTSTIMSMKQQQQQLLSILRNNHHHCAINLYGLPRQYYYMTHHSIIKNIILPNLIYNCDYYIHYYNDTIIETTKEQRGADIGHGNIYFDPNEILLLHNDILQLHYNYYHNHQSNNNNNNNSATIQHYQPPIIRYRTTSEHEFHQQYTSSLIQTIHEYQHPMTRQYLYLPLYEALPFSNTTLINIIKMWHSQQSVFELMDDSSKKHYSRVGMFRNDVLYVTPIDIYQIPSSIDVMDYRNQNKRNKNRRTDDDTSTLLSYDINNEYAVIPNFANYPVNDRMIYGPYDAILIYATYKFRLLQSYIHSNINQQKQYGMHSEQYLYHTILPMIQQYGQVTILQRNDICFLRVRTDYSIRINDCSSTNTRTCTTVQQQNNVHTIIEQQILLRSCQLDVTLPHVPFLLCPPTIDRNNHSTSRTALLHNNNIDSNIATTIQSQWDFCSVSSTP